MNLGNKVPEYSLTETVIPLPDLGNLPRSLALGTIGMPGYVSIWTFICWYLFHFFYIFAVVERTHRSILPSLLSYSQFSV